MLKKLNLCKLNFFIDGAAVASLEAVVNPKISNSEAKNILTKELYGNYSVDNNLQYDNSFLQSHVSSVFVKLGVLDVEDPLLQEVEDFSFLYLNKFDDWYKD